MYLFLRLFSILSIVAFQYVCRLQCGVCLSVCRPPFCTSSGAKWFLGGEALSFEYHIQRGAHSWRRSLSSGIATLHGSLFKIQNRREFPFRDELLWWDEVLCLNRTEEKWRSRRQVAVRKEGGFVLGPAWRKITLHSVLKSSYLPSVSPLACTCLSLVSTYFP